MLCVCAWLSVAEHECLQRRTARLPVRRNDGATRPTNERRVRECIAHAREHGVRWWDGSHRRCGGPAGGRCAVAGIRAQRQITTRTRRAFAVTLIARGTVVFV